MVLDLKLGREYCRSFQDLEELDKAVVMEMRGPTSNTCRGKILTEELSNSS